MKLGSKTAVSNWTIKIIAILIFACFSSTLFAQKNTTFQHSYGGSSDEFGANVLKLPDNGYIMTGFTKSFGAGEHDIIVIRVDSLGRKIWSYVYGGKADEGNVSFYIYPSMDAVLSPDNNIVICSNTESYGKGGKDVYLLKLDLNGNVKWSRTYGGVNDDIGYGLTNDPNGGFLITGETLSYGTGAGDVLLIKTNDTGGVVWSNTYGNSSFEETAYTIIPSIDGNYLLAGYSYSSSNAYDLLLIKVNKNGKLLWSKVFGTSSYDDPNDIIELPDKSIYFDGATYNTSTGTGLMSLTKLDSLGNLKWTKTYDGGGSFRSMIYDNKKNVINIFGNGVFPGYALRVYITRLDTSGGFKFLKSYGPTSSTKSSTLDESHSMISLANGGFLALGAESVYGAGNSDMFLIKTDSGCNTNSCNTLTFSLSPTIYPFSNHNYSFSTTSINPSVSSGVEVNDAAIIDSAICPPFVANFGIQGVTDHEIQFLDSSYFRPNSWKWNFGEPASSTDISILKNPTHTYQYPGTYSVKLVVSNGSGDKDSITKTVKIVLTGISAQSEKLNVELYPNPATNELHVKLSEPQSQLITVTDLIGKTVMTLQTNLVSDEVIQTGLLAKGIYIINIQTLNGNINSRFIKE